jgi:6-phosphogluconolactonase
MTAMAAAGRGDLICYPDAEALARGAASWLLTHVLAAVSAGRRQPAVCLAGGSTPRRVYEILASPDVAPRFPWDRVHWFWGDERFVPHDHPDSNYRMVRAALLSRAPIPDANIHPIPTGSGLPPDAAAAAYERTLRQFYGADALDPVLPLFDVTLLGLGEDGHTASLLPGEPVLEERTRWVAAVAHGRPEVRITLTYPALESSRDIGFLVAGSAKRSVLARARAGDPALPATRVRASGGRLHWLADEAAAAAEAP